MIATDIQIGTRSISTNAFKIKYVTQPHKSVGAKEISDMLKVILRLKIRDPRPFLLPIIITLLITTSVTSANTNQLIFHPEDIKDPGSLAVKLQDTRAAVSNAIAVQLSDETQQLLTEYDGSSSPSAALQKALLTDLNRLLQASSLYNAQTFTNIKFSEQTQTLLSQNPQSGETLVRLNRLLLSDAYPYELASPSEKQNADDPKAIETCRENLRQIKLALDNHRAKANVEPQWLSELSPQYLDEKMLRCPADLTAGVPGVLTEGASDPTLPCSYLYAFRPDQKAGQEILLEIEGDMLPMVRCQHHLLNLSVSGKLYRSGPQRDIYNSVPSTKTIIGKPQQQIFQVDSPSDVEALRTLLGDEFFETPEGQEMLKSLTEQPSESDDSKTPTLADTPQPITKSSHSIFQVDSPSDVEALRTFLGDEFFETQEGQELLKHAATLPSTSKNLETQKLIGAPLPDVTFRNLSGEPVKLEQFRGKFVLLHLLLSDNTSSGPDLQRLEKLLTNVDTPQLQVIGINIGSVETTAALKEKYQISMPLWVVEKPAVLGILNTETTQPHTKRITIFLNPELVVEAVFTDTESLLQKIRKLED